MQDVHDVPVGLNVFDDPRKNPLSEMEYADPAAVDWRARGKMSRTVQMLHGYPVVEASAPESCIGRAVGGICRTCWS